jgi:hypothetical protein
MKGKANGRIANDGHYSRSNLNRRPRVNSRWLGAAKYDFPAHRGSAAFGGLVCDHALDGGAVGARKELGTRRPGAGNPLPHLLVSALRLCAPAGTQSARCAGSHAGVLYAAVAKGLSAICGSREGPVPHLSPRGAQAVSGQRMGPCARSETGWRPGPFAARHGAGRDTLSGGTRGRGWP